MKLSIACLFVACILILFSCSSKQEQRADFISDESNGLIKRQKIGQTDFTLQLIPESWMFQKNASSPGQGRWVAKLTCQLPAGKLTREASDYLNLGIREQFFSIQGTDTAKCILFERIPGVRTNEYVYLLSFPPAIESKEWTLLLDDQQIGLGEVSFVFSNESIRKLKEITN